MTIEPKIKLGEMIKEAREKAGLTQEQLGEKLFISKQAISNWELGKSEIGDESIERLNEILGLNISKKAFMNLEDRKMRKMKIKQLEEIRTFEDYSTVFDEVLRMVVGSENLTSAYAIVIKKFLYIALAYALIEKKRGLWDEDHNLWGIVGYRILTLVSGDFLEKKEDVEKSIAITNRLNNAKKMILDSYNNIFYGCEVEDIVLEEPYEEMLGDTATLYIDDVIEILPRTENSFLTTLIVYLIETKRILEQF